MNEQNQMQNQKFNNHMLPFKSVAAALLFTVILGPVGLLYSSVIGGIIMIFLGFVVLSSWLIVPITMVWVISCVWSVAATNRYNRKLIDAMNKN